METKYVIEGPDKKDRFFIIEVEENEAEKVRYVKRFICEVCQQQTVGDTKLLAYAILGKLKK